ncbi:hypothetical protein HF086_016811 [Spodoptera exigua]|uniref:ABC transporter domain-containing protein n=1 Tax=Spodoptera exigua TaxID=7107 RepID=A0A922MK97_SPOEX|nr:hypothetical protein HF086_016811 [Spodoptera exigua]
MIRGCGQTDKGLCLPDRYGGYSMTLKNNLTNMISWYNNKGQHALPAYLNAANNAILRAVSGMPTANITTYTHPLKISKEPISKATVYQHIADAGISGLVLVAYCLVTAGAAIYLVGARRSQEKRLQLLCGVSPLLYWTTALVWDMMIMAINVGVTAIVMTAFGFPVFVARNNLPAICILLMLYGFACGSLVHLFEKIFSEPILNPSPFPPQETDHARYVLHKFFMLAPQFALGDGLLEIAKNTIQAEVLNRFGMETYKDPFSSSLVLYHCVYLVVVGTVLQLLNLAIEYNCFDGLLARSCTALLGQNGAGKSTTFSMLTGEVRPSSGQLYLNNKLVNSTQLCRNGLINRLLTVSETLRFYCKLRGIDDQEEYRACVDAVCCSGMDPVSRGCVSRGVRAACGRARGVLLSTHALQDARRLAARVALLRAGDLVALAPLEDCLQRFGGGYVVQCRVGRGGASSPRSAWRAVGGRAPHAQLRVLHQHTLHFLVPTQCTGNYCTILIIFIFS